MSRLPPAPNETLRESDVPEPGKISGTFVALAGAATRSAEQVAANRTARRDKRLPMVLYSRAWIGFISVPSACRAGGFDQALSTAGPVRGAPSSRSPFRRPRL